MFTILHERPDGSEELFSAIEVQRIPRTQEFGSVAGVHLLSGPGEGKPGVRCGRLSDGRVFVMNEQGATVARFYLDQPQESQTVIPA